MNEHNNPGKKTQKRWYAQLHWQIAVAMLLAILFGLLLGEPGANAVSWLGDLFLRLLKMIVIPLIFISIIAGVCGVGQLSGVSQMGFRTLLYYMATSLVAILVGLLMANVIHPGDPGLVALSSQPEAVVTKAPSFMELILRLVPENPIEAMVYSDDDPSRGPNILGVIFFAILFGLGILALPEKQRLGLRETFESLFAVMMKITDWIIRLAPIGVFALLAKVVGSTGVQTFAVLGEYMLTVILALAIHAFVTLPLVCWFVARRNPWRMARALSPALATAFSAASSNAALPLTIECAQQRAGISNRTTSFVLPLGATINMDGTALYECVAVLFIAQCYNVELSLVQQLMVVLTALLASVGAAGIPHAGLVMMGIVLGAVGLPLDGIGIILAVDRILDMCRTTVNVFSDGVGAATVARLAGEPTSWPEIK